MISPTNVELQLVRPMTFFVFSFFGIINCMLFALEHRVPLMRWGRQWSGIFHFHWWTASIKRNAFTEWCSCQKVQSLSLKWLLKSGKYANMWYIFLYTFKDVLHWNLVGVFANETLKLMQHHRNSIH